jgi:hypothetical protein
MSNKQFNSVTEPLTFIVFLVLKFLFKVFQFSENYPLFYYCMMKSRNFKFLCDNYSLDSMQISLVIVSFSFSHCHVHIPVSTWLLEVLYEMYREFLHFQLITFSHNWLIIDYFFLFPPLDLTAHNQIQNSLKSMWN